MIDCSVRDLGRVGFAGELNPSGSYQGPYSQYSGANLEFGTILRNITSRKRGFAGVKVSYGPSHHEGRKVPRVRLWAGKLPRHRGHFLEEIHVTYT